MATVESVKAKLQGLIDKANNITSGFHKDLTNAVDFLVRGYERPRSYNAVEDGDLLYRVHFAGGRYNPVDDAVEPFEEGGTCYLKDGTVSGSPPTQWLKSLVENPETMVSDWLVIQGEDTTAVDHRLIGYFPEYDLENKTYTYEFETFRNFDKRHKFYFANGNFVNKDGGVVDSSSGFDPTQPCLALELNKASNGTVDYKLYRQSAGFVNDTLFNRKTVPFAKDGMGEFTARMKVVLKGGAKRNVTLYERHGEVVPSVAVNYWVGDVIPITYTIYHTVNGKDMKVSEGHIYQPANIGLVFGIGNYDALADGEYYGCRNLNICKGDTTKYADVSMVTATADDVLAGETIVSADGTELVGTIPKHEAETVTLDEGHDSYTIPKGYHDGSGKVSIEGKDIGFDPSNIVRVYRPPEGTVITSVQVNPVSLYLADSTVAPRTLGKGVIAYDATGERIVGEAEAMAEISTAAEMDSILTYARVSDVGKFYLYVGETTDAYENGAIYRVTNDETTSFTVEYREADQSGTVVPKFVNYTTYKGTTWNDFAANHEDFTNQTSDTISWRNGETIKLSSGEEVSQSDVIIDGEDYIAY